MKITEPKTPYVRYNADTDEFEGGKTNPCLPFFPQKISTSPCSATLEIPSLDLAGNGSGVSSPILQSPISAEQPPPSPPVSPRRTSFSSSVNGRPSSGSIRSRSGSSSRSTSFNLPNEVKGEISLLVGSTGHGDDEIEVEEEMDEESRFRPHVYPVKQLMAQT